VARAVAPIRDVVAWMLRWLEPGGLAFVPLRSGTLPPHLEGVGEAGIRRYRVPLGGPEREVWVGKKDAASRP
jgi:hypothetical protein